MSNLIQPTKPQQQIQRTVLDNGITLLVIENPVADIIAGRLFLKNAGARVESPNQAGISHLLSVVLTKGTERLTAADIAEQVESVGAGLGTDTAADYFLISMKTVSADFLHLLGLVGEIMRSPSFPEAEVELERFLALQNIHSQQEQPFNVALNQLREVMYGQHPYGVSILGTEDTVSQLTRADLQQYHATYFRPDQLIISLSGRITLDDAVRAVKQVFGNWQPPSQPLPTPTLPAVTPQPQPATTPQDTQQTIIMLGYLSASVQEPDYPVLKLLNTYLGNGLSSRLFVELREKRGLAYDVSAFYPTRLEPSHFVSYIGTAPANTEVAIARLRQEVERLCNTELTPEELQAAQNKLLGQYALGKQSNGQLAQIYGWYETLGLGIEFDTQFQEAVAQVTPQVAQAVACRYFQIDPYMSLVGPV